MSNQEKQTFTIKCTMAKRWIPVFLGMLNKMQKLGNIGASRNVTIYSDGDGDFQPKFEHNLDVELSEGLEDDSCMFDAG